MSTKIKLLIGVIVILIAGVVVVKTLLSTPVDSTTMVTQLPDTAIYANGTLEAKEVVVLAPKTTSKLQALFADEGDTVQAGQVLAKMDISDLAGAQNESIASIAKSTSSLAAQKASLEDLKAKKALADSMLERYTKLLKGGYVTQAEYDSAYATASSAKAQLSSASENLNSFQNDIKKSKASLSAVQSKIDDMNLRSPFVGIVLSRNAEVGSTVGSGVAVFRLANLQTLWVKLYVDETQSGRLVVGQKADVTLRSFPNRLFTGEVARIGAESDRITEERIVYVKLLDAPKLLNIGEQADAKIQSVQHP